MLENNKLIGKIQSNKLMGRVLTKLLGLDFVWDGTRLGIKKENEPETEYKYADLIGPQGLQGSPGINGTDGVTPVKGVDYFTAQDKAEIQTPICDQYDTSHSYVVGDYCIYNNVLYKCTGITTGAFDSTKWSATKISDNLNIVNVSKNEPDEKVWIRRGKNLYNLSERFINAYLNSTTGEEENSNPDALSDFIPIEANKTYTISVKEPIFLITKETFDENKNVLSYNEASYTDVYTFTTENNAKYVRFWINKDATTKMTKAIIDSLEVMIEQSSTKTAYEPYVVKEILVKNNNGVFEKFYSEKKWIKQFVLGYSTIDSGLNTTGFYLDFSLYKALVVQIGPLGETDEGDSAVFFIDDGKFINNIAHLDMYATDAYRCRAFATLHIDSGTEGHISVIPRFLSGWSQVTVAVKGILK